MEPSVLQLLDSLPGLLDCLLFVLSLKLVPIDDSLRTETSCRLLVQLLVTTLDQRLESSTAELLHKRKSIRPGEVEDKVVETRYFHLPLIGKFSTFVNASSQELIFGQEDKL